MAPNNNNNPNFKIFEDDTRTVSCPVPSNQNNQFVLQPAVAANNLPGHLGTGERLNTAYNTSFVPAGAPATVATWNQGYSVQGNWHAGQLYNAINARLVRPVPDAVPFWTAQTLQRQDAAYQAGAPVPATIWPTPAVRMTMHAPTLQVAQQNGMHINSVSPQGHIMWT
ncbi:hypothetical protein Forpe1208_v016250 [Fusarium oxysporum f. sp. rapae]|uniref:Uncharacterized protein n=1 Tax=Fusarium oxysporum f. sp. rapae TaxID=485398 RepID=A0A8J5NGD6_FUSOX|nr:hypothetical protein Forpe1208_v016250 [Fusarium oxysporum f. sp. rapae]